jgi:tetratricopeptide (TPR) repeat protein
MTADTQIETLEAKGLIRLATLRPELEYLFRHWLVQDAAYGSLLKQERRALHGRVGEALEALYPDRMEELAPVLALHFEQAGENEKAIDYFAAGAEHAYGQNAIVEAFDAFGRAAALIDEGRAGEMPAEADPESENRRRRRLVQIQLGRAKAGYSMLSPEEQFEALDRIVAEADALGDPRLIAEVHLFIALARMQNGDPPTEPHVKRSLDRIAEVAEEIGDPALRATPLALIGLSNTFAGSDVRGGVAALEEAVPLMEGNTKDSIGAAFARGALAIGYASLGEFDNAEAAATRAREIAEKGDLIAQLDALIAESMVRSARGQLDRAVPLAQECVDRAEATGASACVVASSWVLGDAFHRLGRFAEARDILQHGSDISLVLDRRVWRPTLQAWLGSSMAALGEVTDGNWDEALATARSIGNRIGEAGILGKRGETLAGKGDLESARPDFEASIAILEELGLRPSLARVLRTWGEALHAAGREAEAEPILRRSLGLFEELGLDAEAGAVRTLLSLGGTKLVFD